ncbi:unnamed protein product [Clonostachys chloroleuca]|uniref:Aminoglycoside phosphotransferase domain-containing protein n=1 Tax=Clonostachys chloroleuca TaxID=1926264 RepID=A0AA35M8P7_9HYPO|nr:unnamed protein product [Clonostachys chloroleuca]
MQAGTAGADYSRISNSKKAPLIANFLVDLDYNITGIIDWELAIVTAKGAAFQSPLLLYNLGELYHEGLSTPSEDEKRLAEILQEETKSHELSALVAQKLHFRVDQVD